MRHAIDETNRRRQIQQQYNEEHGITPQTIHKAVRDLISVTKEITADETRFEKDPESMSLDELKELISKVEKQMRRAAADLDFEQAAQLRDQMVELKKHALEIENENGAANSKPDRLVSRNGAVNSKPDRPLRRNGAGRAGYFAKRGPEKAGHVAEENTGQSVQSEEDRIRDIAVPYHRTANRRHYSGRKPKP